MYYVQVKVSTQLGEPRHYLVLVGGAGAASAVGGGPVISNKRLPVGPARLHLHERRLALTAGVPPRLLGIWELPHLRYVFYVNYITFFTLKSRKYTARNSLT